MGNFTQGTSHDHLFNDCLRSQLLVFGTSHRFKLWNKAFKYIIGIFLLLSSLLDFSIFAFDTRVIVLEELVLDEGLLDGKPVHLKDLIKLPSDLCFLLLD